MLFGSFKKKLKTLKNMNLICVQLELSLLSKKQFEDTREILTSQHTNKNEALNFSYIYTVLLKYKYNLIE